MIAANVPSHLVIGAKVGFLKATRETPSQWQQIAEMYQLDGKTNDLVDLGAPPMPTESKTGVTVQDFVERALRVQSKSWDITTFISHDAVKDDRTGSLERKARGAGQNFNRHMDKLVFQTLNSGAANTYGVGYDGLTFFNDAHIDPGADYQTAQDNKYATALSIDNFETAYVAASTRLDDRGEQSGIIPNTLVVPPALARMASQITANPMAHDASAAVEVNPYNGLFNQIVSPYIDSTGWYLLCTNANVKPILLVMREMPNLQDAWFDPTKPDGGRYYFKYYARYWVAYTDWRLATEGNT